MNKLDIEKVQQIDELKRKGKKIKVNYLQAKQALEKAEQQEKQAIQYVLDNNIFVYAETSKKMKNCKGDIITDTRLDYLIDNIDNEIYTSEFSPKLQQAFKTLFNIDNPLHFTYTYPFQRKYWSFETQYLKVAIELLNILGDRDNAERLNKAIEGYLQDDIKQKLMNLNDDLLK